VLLLRKIQDVSCYCNFETAAALTWTICCARKYWFESSRTHWH